jgi:F-type H+-transporting ATPase subunit b
MTHAGSKRKQPKTGRWTRLGRMAVLLVVMALICTPASTLWAAEGEHGEAHGEAHAEEHGPKGWVSTDTYRVMNFAVLAVGLFFILRKPLSQALRGRIQGIQAQLEELEAKKGEAEKQLAAYNEKFAGLEKEAERIVGEYVKQGEEAKARIIREAETAAEKLKEQARRNIDSEFERAREQLHAEILEQSLAKAEEIIKNRITTEDQTRMVDEYLKKVVA